MSWLNCSDTIIVSGLLLVWFLVPSRFSAGLLYSFTFTITYKRSVFSALVIYDIEKKRLRNIVHNILYVLKTFPCLLFVFVGKGPAIISDYFFSIRSV
jgi:hypothetical protein